MPAHGCGHSDRGRADEDLVDPYRDIIADPVEPFERIAILRYFLSRASQDLALRPESADAGRQEAQQAFEKWVDGGAKSVKGKASK